MKRIYLVFLTFLSFITLSGFELYDNYNIHYSSGPDAGLSGDPAMGKQTCINCHNGSSLLPLSSVISSDIPSTGYLPNTTYTINVRVQEGNRSRYGFQISPQNSSGTFLGKLVVTDPVTTQLNFADENYINHTFEGTRFPAGIGQWSFQWVAPAAGAGDVTFYGSLLLSDNSSSASGDVVANSTLTASENKPTAIHKNIHKKNTIAMDIFPNPVSKELRYFVELEETTNLNVTISQTDGRIINSVTLNNLAPKKHELSLPITNLSKGLYQLNISGNGKQSVKSFLIE